MKELQDDRNAQEVNIRSILGKMEKLDHTGMDISVDRSAIGERSAIGDRSVLMEQMQGIEAVLDPDSRSVTLVCVGGPNG